MPGTSNRSKLVALRFPLDLLARVEGEAQRRAALAGIPCSVSAALVALVRERLDGVALPAREPPPVAPAPSPASSQGKGEAPASPGPAPDPADAALRARVEKARESYTLDQIAEFCGWQRGSLHGWLVGKRGMPARYRGPLTEWLDAAGV
jgi:hypothetical protein